METEQALAGGYIMLPRQLLEPDGELMDKPPLYFKLWIWLLAKANYRDRGQLQRGQLVTTGAKMQAAMAGGRKETPTKDQIRSAYEALRKADMIATERATRGMKITILNYDFYQNPKSYQSHS